MSTYHKNDKRAEPPQTHQTEQEPQHSGGFMVDNSQEAMEGRELQEMANSSPQAKEGAQLKQMAAAHAVKNAPKRKVNKTGIPDRIKATMEACWRVSLDEVRVHYNSEKPALINAHAYTEGLNVYIASGQEQHLAHELSHVLQQLKGQVKPERSLTNGTDNVSINESSSLEKEAENTGKKINKAPIAPDTQETNLKKIKAPNKEIVQRAKVSSHYGEFEDKKYEFIESNSKLDFELEFKPNDGVKATKVGLSQVVKAEENGKSVPYDANAATKMTADGYEVDQLAEYANPLYATGGDIETGGDSNKLEDYETDSDWGQHAEKKDDGWTQAILKDTPSIDGNGDSSKEFETSAIALEGEGKGKKYYGSVKWGFKKDKTGKLSKIDFELVSEGAPSQTFLEAAKKWNKGKTRGTLKAKAGIKIIVNSKKKDLKKGTKVYHIEDVDIGDVAYNEVEVLDGALQGQTGYIKAIDLEDGNDGNPTVDLPLPKIKVPIEDKLHFGVEKDKSSSKDSVLSKSTRLKIIEDKNNDAKKVKVEIVQGDQTGKQGWVEKSKLKDE